MKVYNRRAIEVDEVVDELLGYADRSAPHGRRHRRCCSTRRSTTGERCCFEGGQATMLDVDHGTYPFVTSSNATAGGACTGSGVAPNRLDRVIGIVKAYTTRVGAGPFPTELFDERASCFASTGFEFGTTTGRPRRCGWYDAADRSLRGAHQRRHRLRAHQARRAHRPRDEIPVCVAYDVDGVRFDEMPVSQTDFHHATPIYEYFPGWSEDITGAAPSTTCPRTPRTTCWRSRRCQGRGSRRSASVLDVTRSCSCGPWSDQSG